MGTYYIPRNYKGETRFLYIFTIKSLISSVIGAFVGSIFFVILNAVGMKMAGIITLAVFSLIGYVIGALKVPTIVAFPITKKIGGEPIGEIIMKYIKYKKTKKIYLYIESKKTKKEEKVEKGDKK